MTKISRKAALTGLALLAGSLLAVISSHDSIRNYVDAGERLKPYAACVAAGAVFGYVAKRNIDSNFEN